MGNPIPSFPQVQVVISSIENQWKSNGTGNRSKPFNGAADTDTNVGQYKLDWLGTSGRPEILANMTQVFPNLRLILLFNGNTVWWSGNGGGGPDGSFAEPGLGEDWKWGIKYAIAGQPTGTEDAVLDWLTELWRNTDVWTQNLVRSDGAHPAAAGEDFGVAGTGLGSAALRPAFLAHYGTQTWWTRTVYHQPVTLAAEADTYIGETTIDANVLKHGWDGSNITLTFDSTRAIIPRRFAAHCSISTRMNRISRSHVRYFW